MTLEQLRVFVTVADYLHVTRAAEALGMTQSAASAAIAALETRHGTRLFHRVGRRIALTASGQAFLGEARAVLRRAAVAEQALVDLGELRRGSLTIWASQTLCGYWLPGFLVQFHGRFPGVTIQVRDGNTEQVVAAILRGEAELGFIEGEIVHPALVQETVDHDEIVVVAAPGHPWVVHPPATPAAVTSMPWIAREMGSGTRQVMELGLRRLGVDPGHLPLALELPSNEAVRAAVESGGGVAALSWRVVEARVMAGRLAVVSLPMPTRRFCVVRHGDHSQGRAEMELLGLIRAYRDQEGQEPVEREFP